MNTNLNADNKKPWDRERIKFELRERGYTLSMLDRKYGMCTGYFSQALIMPLRKAEKVMADILGVPASEIWPARYGSDGRPHQGRFLPENDGLAKKAARQALKDVS